jgi:hypothetical protein
LFANSCFIDGIADGWTTDNSTNIKADQQAAATTALGNFSAINGNGAYCDGSSQNALDSVYLSNTSATTDSHLFSPTVAVDPTQTYVFNNFVNVTSTTGEVDFVVDEYNSAGTWISDKYVAGVSSANANGVEVGYVNFTYTPSSSSVASARLQVVAHGAGLTAYYDNAQMFPESTAGTGAPSNLSSTPPPVAVIGDLNGDGKVDAADLSILLSNWGKTGATAAQGDLDCDGVINATDLSILLAHWSV